MLKLETRTARLIAIGASVAANCQPCLQVNISQAVECGASEQEIIDAIQVGRMVRNGAASKMDKFILGLEKSANSASTTAERCECIPTPV